MTNEEQIKEMVRQKYSEIALQDRETNAQSCCGSGSCSTEVYNIMSEDYKQMEGYDPDADLGIGCGLPTQFAKIKKGDVVIDLGCGAGNDCFVARAETGETGKVIGIDFTPAMIEKARINAEKRGFNNVEFYQGDIENMPVSANVANVVISNCVLNLVPNKQAVFKDIYRVLKEGGHFSISDVVITGELPEKLKSAVEMYAGCVAGASDKKEYFGYIEQAGFKNIILQSENPIMIPDDILGKYLTKEEVTAYKANPIIWSVTVYAEKKDCNCNKAEIAVSKFEEGYNCTQAVTYAFADEVNIDKNILMSIATGFGAGIGRKQEVCGAVTGAIIVLGAKYGRKENEPASKTETTYSKAQEFVDEFIKEKGSIICSELLQGCNLLTEEGQKLFKDKKMKSEICNKCVELACNILQK